MTSNGIECHTDNADVYLDPKKVVSGCINFVSHAHSDHLPQQNGGMILSSRETCKIASHRGFMMENFTEKIDNLSLIDSGHIFGARGIFFDDIFYTGDICTRKRGFLDGAKIPKCKTLITECTFGLPEFIFPSIDEIKNKVNTIISDAFSKGRPTILLGYQLGKAQAISYLFDHWQPMFYHDSIKAMNNVHKQLGVPLKDAPGHTEAESNGLLNKKPWLMIAPMMSERNPFIRRMKSKFGAITIGFSGWAQTSRFAFGRRADYSIPLSDHCDFDELVKVVKESHAEKIYTVHGFVDEFAAYLTKVGFDAQPLRPQCLDDFV